MKERDQLSRGLRLIFDGIAELREAFEEKRQFTIDGRLVGDIGEVVAELEYDIKIDAKSQDGHDGTTFDGRRVQIKATFQNHLTFKGGYDLYLGLKLDKDGRPQEVFNGPGAIIAERYSHRKGIGSVLLSFPISELNKLKSKVDEKDKVRRRSS